MDFYFLVEKGILSSIPRKKIKRIRSLSLFASEKDEFPFPEKSNYTGKAEILLMYRLVEQWICAL